MSTKIFLPDTSPASTANSTEHAPVVVLATGGTIDKSYPTGQCGAYAFEFGKVTGAERILTRSHLVNVPVRTILQKDSQDVTDDDRKTLLGAISELGRNSKTGEICCVITHGTDTIIDTAKFLHKNLKDMRDLDCTLSGIIVLTGAFIPEQMKNSDADFNLGFAVGCAKMYSDLVGAGVRDSGNKTLHRSVTVKIALQGQLFSVENVRRLGDGSFVTIGNIISE